MSEETPTLAAARKIAGRYRLEALLGAGGMGEVHRAFDERLQRRVAVKLLRSHDESGAPPRREAIERMLREARSVAALRHPNVVAVFDVGEDAGAPYVVLEHLEGQPMSRFVGRADVPLTEKARWLRDTALALGAAHEAGLVHRDLKPDNVFVCRDGTVKVLDFGIARTMRTEDATTQLTTPGMVVGTPVYMSPEQIRGEAVDARSDQFAWGVVAYELMTGVLPWTRTAHVMALFSSVTGEDPTPPSTRNPEISPALETVVLRALAKSRDDRFVSMAPIAAVLDGACSPAALALTLVHATPASLPTAPPIEVAPPRTRRSTEADHGTADEESAAERTRLRAITDPPLPSSESREAIAAYARAMGHFQDSNWAAAHAELSAAATLDPQMAAAQMRLALTGRFDGGMSAEQVRRAFRSAVDRRRTLSGRDRALQRALEPLLLREPPDIEAMLVRIREACERYPGDAELHAHAVALMLVDEPAEAARFARRATELDPDLTVAWQCAAIAHADLGEHEETARLFNHAIELSPNSADAYSERGLWRASRGDAARAAADARQSLALDPSPMVYDELCSAMHAAGQSTESLRGVLRQKWARLGMAERACIEACDEAHLAALTGDFAAAEARADDTAREAAERSDADAYGKLTIVALRCAMERGDDARARAIAARHLDGRGLRRAAARYRCDATPLALAIAERAGSLAPEAAEAIRTEWRGSFFASPGVLWATAYAPAVNRPEAREHARAAGMLGFRFLRALPARADAGRLFVALGEHARGLELFARACAAATAFDDPFRHVLAHLWRAEALELTGDVAGARAAYEIVIARWSAHAPECTTVAMARRRLSALTD